MSGEQARFGLHREARTTSNGNRITTILGELPDDVTVGTRTFRRGTDVRLTEIESSPPKYRGRIGHPRDGLIITDRSPKNQIALVRQMYNRLLPLAPVEHTPVLEEPKVAAPAKRRRTG